MNAREEILRAIAVIVADRPDGVSTPAEVVATLRHWGSPYTEPTIRTHNASRMCIDAPPHHQVRYADAEQVARGHYRHIHADD